MNQQLRFDAVDAGRLLQGFDHMDQQPAFDLLRAGSAISISVSHEQIADHSFITFIDEKGVAEDLAPVDGSVAGQDLGIDVAQDHLCRAGVVPGEQARPDPGLVLH